MADNRTDRAVQVEARAIRARRIGAAFQQSQAARAAAARRMRRTPHPIGPR